MKKCFYLLLSVVVLTIVGCNKEEVNNPDSDSTPTPSPEIEYDPNGEVDFNLYFCVSDTIAMCMDLGVEDKLHPELDCSKFIQRAIDTTKTDDKAIYTLFAKESYVGAPKLVVVELPIRLKAGEYKFQLTGKRKVKQITADTISVAFGCYLMQLNEKVTPEIYKARATTNKITKDPNNNIEKWFNSNSKIFTIPFSFKVLK